MGIDFLSWNPDQLCELGQGVQPLCAHFSIREMGTIVLLPLWVCISLEVAMCSWCITHSQYG